MAKLTPEKAAELLKNPPSGRPLTNSQKKYFSDVIATQPPTLPNVPKMGGWMDKYEQGGMILKKKGDNYGKQGNYNDAKVSTPPGFVGMGYDTKGRNYSPAWGGQFKNGGFLQDGGYLQKAKGWPVIKDVEKVNEYGQKVPDWEAMAKQAKAIGAKQVRTKSGATIVFDNNWQATGATDPDPELAELAELQWGGFLQPNDVRLPSAIAPPNREGILSSELARSIGGEDGEPAYLVPSFKGGRRVDEKKEFNKTGEHLGGPFKTWQEAEKFGEMRHEYVEKGQSLPSPFKWWGDMAMGGGIPGAVGFTYARVAGSAPANGKYTKKTKASAQNGQEMKFYQEGLDFRPKTISKNGSVIKDDMGQWAHPGEITEIGSNEITMQGVDYPVLGVSDVGDIKLMQPGEDYKFKGEKVTEYPIMKKGGWLNKYK